MNGDPPDWVLRLMSEREDLNSKLHKLYAYLASESGKFLDDTDRMLLGFQGMMMENYLSVLDVRLQRYQQGAGR